MDEREKLKLVDAIEELNEGFGRKPSAERNRWYARALADLPLEPLLHAISVAAKYCETMPSPAKLRQLTEKVAVGESRPSWQIFAPSWKDKQGRSWTRKWGENETPVPPKEELRSSPEYVKAASPLIQRVAMATKNRNWHQVLEEIEQMHGWYPDAGWDETYEEMWNLWTDKGYLAQERHDVPKGGETTAQMLKRLGTPRERGPSQPTLIGDILFPKP